MSLDSCNWQQKSTTLYQDVVLADEMCKEFVITELDYLVLFCLAFTWSEMYLSLDSLIDNKDQ